MVNAVANHLLTKASAGTVQMRSDCCTNFGLRQAAVPHACQFRRSLQFARCPARGETRTRRPDAGCPLTQDHKDAWTGTDGCVKPRPVRTGSKARVTEFEMPLW